MSSPNRLLENKDSQAALSRFFYNLEPLGGVPEDSSGLFDYNLEFAATYSKSLRHRLSLIASKAIDGAGQQADIDDKPADFDHQATMMVAFDKTWAEQGIYGWQINIAAFTRSMLMPREGRVVIGVYSGAQIEHTRLKRFDGQGREIASAARQTTAPHVAAIVARNLLYPMIENETIENLSATLEKQRGDLAQKIVDFGQTRKDSVVNRQDREAMEKQLYGIAFPPVNFRFDTAGIAKQIIPVDHD